MPNRTDIIIVDQEFTWRGVELAEHRDFFAEVLREYNQIMDYLLANIEGTAADEIANIRSKLQGLPDTLLEVCSAYQSDCDSFVRRIDEADSFVY
jgi:hypothetical protein